MIPYDIDPSLHSGSPPHESLDDGFSPPAVQVELPVDVPPAVSPVPSIDLPATKPTHGHASG